MRFLSVVARIKEGVMSLFGRKEEANPTYNPDKRFVKNGRIIDLKIIISGGAETFVLLKGNWPFVPVRQGEVNETSNDLLTRIFKNVGLRSFSIAGDSMLFVAPGILTDWSNRYPSLIRSVVNILFLLAEREEKVAKLIESCFSPD